ncbi:murein hydrolase activator EnvC [Euzebya sp.]|uniref:murein hydrolase activator EnvC family protein n=1 Tax=Euzebya sp. TaxID=1971409 RepID=UPI00351865B6
MTVLLVVVVAVPSGAAGLDVEDAEVQLDEARDALTSVEAGLDRLSGEYEEAISHLARLEDERGDVGQRVDAARGRVASARAGVEVAIRRLYMRPGGFAEWAIDAVQASPSVGSALHRIALLQRLPVGMAARADRLRRTTDLVADEVAQHAMTLVGVAAGAADLADARRRLEAELAATRAVVTSAQDRLEDARRAAARRAAAEEAARAATHLDQPPPTMACPLGLPNGFTDSWGAPRSGGRGHEGVDMFAARGTPVYAVADGTVRVGDNRLGGLTVNLEDVAGNAYYYAHLDATTVRTGQQVSAGDVIGLAGTSGNAAGTPPHLHWQVRPGGGPTVNPFPLADLLCRSS